MSDSSPPATLAKRLLAKLVNDRNPNSWSARMRMRRLRYLSELVETLPRPLRILDVGGLAITWERIGFAGDPQISITLLNVHPVACSTNNITAIVGDARNMPQFADSSFDLVFSNSVIEHVGGPEDWKCMASEIRRVGRNYFVQTPNRYFPLEPHFLFPFFQFLPRRIQIWLHMHIPLGWFMRQKNRAKAEANVDSIHLLTLRDVKMLFPDGQIVPEKAAGLIKSWMVHRISHEL